MKVTLSAQMEDDIVDVIDPVFRVQDIRFNSAMRAYKVDVIGDTFYLKDIRKINTTLKRDTKKSIVGFSKIGSVFSLIVK